ncbi:MAG: hypothetical protein HY815_27765 [Candidatus Riflebacteria bacterium]|nr:hypothetical protein [Candidatus Riflebacteria bacterium]
MGRCLSVLLLLVLSVPVRAATAPGGHAVTPAPVASPKQSPPPAKDVEFATYGFIDLLTYYEDSEFLGVDAPIFVMSKGYRAIGVTARATRLGTSIDSSRDRRSGCATP